jgi:hypothetical protein
MLDPGISARLGFAAVGVYRWAADDDVSMADKMFYAPWCLRDP